MELICNDSQRLVTMANRFIPFIIRKFVVSFIYICWLLTFFGWRIVPGLFVFAFLGMYRILIIEIDLNLRRDASKMAEERLGHLREFLTNILSIKLNGFEQIYEKKIQSARW